MKSENLGFCEETFRLLEELKQQQQQLLLRMGRRIVPNLTPEDVLQPNDFPELENHAPFRYEEGVLAGILTVEAALKALPSQSKDLHAGRNVQGP
jgi:hypothetical protein